MNDLLNNQELEKQKQDLQKVFEKERKGLFGFFIERFRLTYLLMALIFVFGVLAIFTLPKESEPEVEIPFALVNTVYQGANPADVEELVTDKIEEKIENVDDLKVYNSTSKTGISSIYVEFSAEADLDKSITDLKDAVDSAKPHLPSEAEDPFVMEVSFNDMPIVTYSLLGSYSDAELKEYAEIVESELESIAGVSEVDIIGGAEREFLILVDPAKLAQHGLSMSQIAGAIQRENMNLPAGNIEIDDYKYNVRTTGRFENFEDLNSIIVAYQGEAPIYLSDLGEMKDTFKEKESLSRISLNGQESQNAISLQIRKKTGGNILRIVDEAEDIIAELDQGDRLPANLEIKKTNDNAVFIKDDINTLGTSGLQTMLLIFIFLFAVLGIRGALITGFSVPIAFLMAFIVLQVQGMTLNSMVLFSLVLSLGLMVDNSIIIMEGITEYMHRFGKTPFEAAILSIWNYKWPIIAGTMTTVSAFFPQLLVSGMMGEYMGIIPKTVTATLVSSLFVSLVIIPALVTRFCVRRNGKIVPKQNIENNGVEENKKKKHHLGFIGRLVDALRKHYVIYMRQVLASRKRRWTAVGVAILLFILAVLMPMVGLLKVEMFPTDFDLDYFAVNIKLPVGSGLEKTDEVTRQAEKIINQILELDNYVTNLGSSFNLMPGTGSDSETHVASIIVNLQKPEDGRERKSYQIADSVRDALENLPGGEVRVQELTAGPPTGAPLEARITGYDLNTLAELSEQTRMIIEQIPGTINVEDSLTEFTGEINFAIKRVEAKKYGLDSMTIASTLRNALYGVKASYITVAGDDIDITVKYSDEDLSDVDDLKNLEVYNPMGQRYLMKQVADISFEPSVQGIDHRNGEKIVTVTANLESGYNAGIATKQFEEQVAGLNLPEGYKIEMGGEMEDIAQSFTEIFTSMIVAVFLIVMILVLQFNSFKQPFIIMFALPLAIIGAIMALVIMRLNFSLPAFIGIVALAGIVVNDAIVLIDRINKNMKRKMDFIEGIVEAGVARMQPIFLTSATTIAGIFPLTFANEMWKGLGWGVIGGLLFATVLTLIFVPILYSMICRKDYDKGALF